MNQGQDHTGKLLDGFHRFRARHFGEQAAPFRELVARGQAPKVMIIACSDSRVDPSIITDAAPGDLFVVRNVANLVPPYEPDGHYHGTSAALEFAVRGLAVEDIIVFGHAHCGGIAALMAEPQASRGAGQEFVAAWMTIAYAARTRVLAETAAATATPPGAEQPEARARACEQAAIEVSLGNLEGFPWIAERIEAGALRLHGWYFDLAEGRLHALDQGSGRWDLLA